MSGVYLKDIRMKRESKSFADSLHAVLTAAGMFEGPKYMLSGLTGMAFKFSVHERLLPLSVSAYGNWGDEHSPGVDNIGVLTIWDGGRSRHPTFRFYQQDAIRWVKRSLDEGVGVIYWLPEFGVIHGYDDEDRIFYIQDGYSSDDRIVLYDNFGLNFTEFWYARTFGGAVRVPLETMVLESVRLALHDWDTPYRTLPNTDIGSGRLAYSYLTQALRSGDYDEGGARYILSSFVYARDEIRRYLAEVAHLWPQLAEAGSRYGELAGLFDGWSLENAQGLIGALEQAAALEERAMELFRELSRQYPDPRRDTVPRWGISSAR
ncbi:hypothetical protein COLU111180_13315 [Cohnella lubricantis]|uniref:DUF4872 domain-containing protein n=1 Tax=Cohnella lubricantis TaxID=2163172 RepID=A0A841T738_9BACL|nr:hypothetical protein [Cohnella lubricantis]MBB6675929.1 hypothetical protein [Cohnella lubricantis]MBP2117154.1 hypothetical protein [Cohnella lubricantis]